MRPEAPPLDVRGLVKRFRLHQQGGVELTVLDGADLRVGAGECVVLSGPSGAGKSTLLRCIYGNYLPQGGSIRVRHEGGPGGGPVELVGASPQLLVAVRRLTIGYVSQFLRVIPRLSALQVVAEPLVRAGTPPAMAEAEAARLLEHLAIPRRLWTLAPQTFSGGEQQRVNIARGFARPYPILLLDEPTSALDAENRARVVGLIEAAKKRGAALVGVFHDADISAAVATRSVAVTPYAAAA